MMVMVMLMLMVDDGNNAKLLQQVKFMVAYCFNFIEFSKPSNIWQM